MTMRRSRNECPNCKAVVAPNYRFCLACGAELPESVIQADIPEPEPAPVTKKSRGRKRDAKPAADAPTVQFPYLQDTAPQTTKRSSGRLRSLLLLLVLVGGAVGGMLYWNEHQTDAAQKITWDEISALDYMSIWEKLERSRQGRPEGVPPTSIETRAVGVADDGTIMLSLDGAEFPVQLAGVPADFAFQCLGEKALKRLNKVFPEDAVVYVLLDGKGRLKSTSSGGLQSVYLWGVESDSGKVRYANEELIASGESEFEAVTLRASDAGKDLSSALKRAQTKERGRYQPGACT